MIPKQIRIKLDVQILHNANRLRLSRKERTEYIAALTGWAKAYNSPMMRDLYPVSKRIKKPLYKGRKIYLEK